QTATEVLEVPKSRPNRTGRDCRISMRRLRLIAGSRPPGVSPPATSLRRVGLARGQTRRARGNARAVDPHEVSIRRDAECADGPRAAVDGVQELAVRIGRASCRARGRTAPWTT